MLRVAVRGTTSSRSRSRSPSPNPNPNPGPNPSPDPRQVRGAEDLYNLTLLGADPRVATLRPPLDAARIGSAHLSAYRCFLGEANISAQLENATVRCATPPFETSQVAGLRG